MARGKLAFVENGDDSDGLAGLRIKDGVVLDAETHAKLVYSLAHDKRAASNSSRGLALFRDLPELGLLQGGRVVSSPAVPFTAAVVGYSLFPAPLQLWRPSRETLARNRCPLFSVPAGLDPTTVLTVDALHSLYLGVMKDLCRDAVWHIIPSNLWGAPGGREEHLANVVACCRHELQGFYARRQRANPEEGLTRIPRLTQKRLGTRTRRMLKIKGAETWGFLLFLVDFLSVPRHIARLGADGRAFLAAAECLVALVGVMDGCGMRVELGAQQRMVAHWQRFIAVTTGMESLHTPKRHAVAHMLLECGRLGAPATTPTGWTSPSTSG